MSLRHMTPAERARAIESAPRDEHGRVRRSALARWGVPYPPPQGWQADLIEHGCLEASKRAGWGIPDDFRQTTTPDDLEERETTWFCLTAEPKKEARVASALREMGYGACVPLERYQAKVRNRKSTHQRRVQRPALVGYVFIGVVPKTVPDWRGIEQIDGAGGAIVFDRTRDPVPVPWRELAIFKARAAVAEYRDPRVLKLEMGEAIRVDEGPFSGVKGPFDGMEKGGARVVIGNGVLIVPLKFVSVA